MEQGGLWRHHADLIADAEFLLTEGGGIRVHNGQRSYNVDIAEKAPCWLQLEAHGPAGHGSMPFPETSVTRLIRALEKIRLHETEVKVIPAVQAYFSELLSEKNRPKLSNTAIWNVH